MNSVKEAYDETNKFLSFLQAISMYKEGRISLEDLSLQALEGAGNEFHSAFSDFVSGRQHKRSGLEVTEIEDNISTSTSTSSDFNNERKLLRIPKRRKPIEKDEEYSWGSPENSEEETPIVEKSLKNGNDFSDYDDEFLSDDNEDFFASSKKFDSKRKKQGMRRKLEVFPLDNQERMNQFKNSIRRPMTMTLSPDELLRNFLNQPQIESVSTPVYSYGSAPKKSKAPGEIDSSRTKWTQEEDQRLREIIQNLFPDRSPSNWALIAETLGTKNANQCCQHWFRVLRPNIVRGPFSIEEEDKLLNIVNNFGEGPIPWSKVADELPGRVDLQCRNYYLQRKKSLSHSWSKQEDTVLYDLMFRIQTHDRWQLIAEELNQRTRSKRRGVIRSARECKLRSEILPSFHGAI